MNERIKELAEQATEVSEWLSGNCSPDAPDIEKFARLIVKECADFAYKEADHLEDEFERGRADDLRRWANVMKKHFGVE